MGKMVALGGGEIGRPGYPVETTSVDEEIIRLSGVKNPKLLFIPTASGDPEIYVETVMKHFGTTLGCRIDSLLLIKDRPDFSVIKRKISGADIVYVGGGNTLRMLRWWRKTGVDKLLVEAYRQGTVMAGLSAGSICWFRYGHSHRLTATSSYYIKIRGMNLVDALFCPHYDVEADRKPALKEMMKKSRGFAIAIDNCGAIEIVDDTYRIISSKNEANAYRVYWKKGEFHEEVIGQEQVFRPLRTLLPRI